MSDITHAEREALAILRTGGSFAEAADLSGLTIAQVQDVWKQYGDSK